MKHKNNIFLVLLILAGSAEAISFRDYYYGNPALNIRPHQKEVNAQIATGDLRLIGEDLTDLIGFLEVPGVTALRAFYFSENPIVDFPPNFFWHLPALKILNLENNRRAKLPQGTFYGLSALESLSLSHNQLVALPENIFYVLTDLKFLYLDDNQFTTLPANIFNGLVELEVLSLANNQLGELSQNIFNKLFNLQVLDLENNQLNAISRNFFTGLMRLETLDLANNQITTVPTGIFNGLNLRQLYLGNNPIPLTQAQLAKEIELPAHLELIFKNQAQQQAEQDLFAAIKNADTETMARLIKAIKNKDIKGPSKAQIAISKIRDANGDNLLHAAIRDAAERIKVIDGMSVGLPEDEKKAVKEVQAEQKAEINDRYMKIISIIFSCGEECVQDLLFTPNAEKQQAIDMVIAKLGFDSPIYKAILEGLNQEEKTTSTEEKEKNEAQK